MTPDRCPACGAAVAPGAPWCTLCFADLRPRPEPAPEPVVAPAASLEPAYAAAALVPSVVPGVPPEAPAAQQRADSPPPESSQRVAGPAWPCSSCGESVGFDLDACPSCGTGFLSALGGGSLEIQLPGNVDPRSLTPKAKWAVAGIGALALMLVLLLIAVIGGALL